jgi:hypothetical protein
VDTSYVDQLSAGETTCAPQKDLLVSRATNLEA